MAAKRGRIEAVRFLLSHGAAAQAVDDEGQGALVLARSGGFDEVAAEPERGASR